MASRCALDAKFGVRIPAPQQVKKLSKGSFYFIVICRLGLWLRRFQFAGRILLGIDAKVIIKW